MPGTPLLLGAALLALAALALAAHLRGKPRDLTKILSPMPDWLEPVRDPEAAALARLALGLAMGKPLRVHGLLKARRGGAKFYIADLAEPRRRGAPRRFTAAFASAESPLFPPFRLRPRERGVKLPVNLVEVPGAPTFAAAFFLTSPEPASAQVFFLGGPAAFFALRTGWRAWCDGRLAVLSRGEDLVPGERFEAFARDAGEALEKVFRLGAGGFSGFHPGEQAIVLRGRGL